MSTDSGVVIFDSGEFKIMNPQFENVPDALLTNYFNSACLLLDNTKNSPVQDVAERKQLLYLLTCHIATLKARGDTLVGNITSAAEGKVNVGVTPLVNANWYQQTTCGALYWQATAKYRLGVRYFVYRNC